MSNNIKYLFLSIFLIAFLGFSIPQICRANGAVGFLSYNIPAMIIIVFMGIWIIEALVINDKVKGTSQKSLFSALIVNIVTVSLGFLGESLGLEVIAEIYGWLPSLIFLFLSTVLIEAIILHFCYYQEQWIKIFIVSFIMNLESYVFLGLFVVLEIITIGSILLTVVLVPYFFLKSFEFISKGKEISKSTRKKTMLLILVLSLTLCGVIFKGVMKRMEKFGGRPIARDARRQSDMRQLTLAQEMHHEEHEKYLNLPGCTPGTDCYPESIGDYLTIVPEDPLNEEPHIYKGFNNDADTQKFCYYAKLEHERREGCLFFIASHEGSFCKEEEPTSLIDCEDN